MKIANGILARGATNVKSRKNVREAVAGVFQGAGRMPKGETIKMSSAPTKIVITHQRPALHTQITITNPNMTLTKMKKNLMLPKKKSTLAEATRLFQNPRTTARPKKIQNVPGQGLTQETPRFRVRDLDQDLFPALATILGLKNRNNTMTVNLPTLQRTNIITNLIKSILLMKKISVRKITGQKIMVGIITLEIHIRISHLTVTGILVSPYLITAVIIVRVTKVDIKATIMIQSTPVNIQVSMIRRENIHQKDPLMINVEVQGIAQKSLAREVRITTARTLIIKG